MEKFALPNVVIEKLPEFDGQSAASLMMLVCQAIAENPQIADPANHLFRIADLQPGAWHDFFKKKLLDNATAEVKLALLKAPPEDAEVELALPEAPPEEGHSDNRAIELDFRNYPGASHYERQDSALTSLWGSTDEIVRLKHDIAVKAASARARQKLPELRSAFVKGFAPGERLLLKAPFARDDEGNEWMWVEVLKWTDQEKIEGLLQNDPVYIKKLRTGAQVTIKESEVFDYIYYRADGSQEGNGTGRVMEKQNGPKLQK